MSRFTHKIIYNGSYLISNQLRQLFIRKTTRTLFSRSMATSNDGNQSTPKKFRNRLGQEKSPYLLQHANNPVDWYPWGQDAFDKAKAENKPIFLSVGYSTCHWCHVMERESFESEEIGNIMNENFVAIKVDREERPDVDRVYMNFIQATSGGGGWPMSVWMTADLKPFAGGTYFPPDDRYYGKPGFKTILQRIAEKWQNHKPGVEEQSTTILDALIQHNTAVASSDQLPSPVAVTRCYSQLEKSYEPKMGGFGKAPKFPQPVNFDFMLRRFARDPESDEGKKALEMTLYTLRMMAKGGMNDHVAKACKNTLPNHPELVNLSFGRIEQNISLPKWTDKYPRVSLSFIFLDIPENIAGQGFHRYSTDNDWHVPHFEKMLYDQGQLAVSYAEAYQATKHQDLAQVARDILKYCSRDLSDTHGGFYSAEDADSLPTQDSKDKKEGAFCVWTEDEITSLLSKPVEGLEGKTVADIFSHHYNVQSNGNVDPYKDPHDELKNQNVLIVQGSNQKTAEKYELAEDIVTKLLEDAKQILFEFRKNRPPPHLDNKMITAWNGLMISGYAKVGQALHEKAYIDRALKAVEFLRTNLYQPDSRTLLRSCYVGESKDIQQIANPIEGFVDDYSFLIRGLLDLYEACFDQRLLQWAEELQQKQDELFWDGEDGGYFSNSGKDPSIVMRLKEDQDGAEPSANSVSANNLLRLSCFLDKPQLKEQAEKMFKLFYERLEKIPVALPEMVCALMFYQSTPKQIIIRGGPESDDTQEMMKCVHSKFLPNKVLILADGKSDSFLYNRLSLLSSLEMIDGKATAYVCENYSCSQPVNSVEELSQLLK